MDQAQKEIARHALQAALKRLDSATQASECEGKPLPPNQQSIANAGQDSSNDVNSPIVLIMLAPVSLPGAENATIKSNSASSDSKNYLSQGYEQGLTHPGFEKFALREEDPKASAPKPCFIEPDRVCVNSGACEMRGY